MDILTKLIWRAKKELVDNASSLRIDNILVGKSLYTMKDCERVFTDMNFCQILLEQAYGFAYFQGEIDFSISKFVNLDVFEALEHDIPLHLKVALVDALYCIINLPQQKKLSGFKGSIREKAKQRAGLLLDQVPERSKILLIGAVTEIVEEAAQKNCVIKVLDLEEQKHGLPVHNIEVLPGSANGLENILHESDCVIATGMIFTTNTYNDIFKYCRKQNCKLILYMETGSNFGEQLVEMGAAAVLSEFFPYYDFFGETKYLLSK